MKTLKPSLFVSAALAGILAAAVAAPAFADHHEGEKKHEHKGKKQKKGKGMPAKNDAGLEKVHCLGINACKGKSECGVDGKHACAGHNACKGQGWVTLAKKECLDKKGVIVGGHGGAPVPEAPAKAAEPVKK